MCKIQKRNQCIAFLNELVFNAVIFLKIKSRLYNVNDAKIRYNVEMSQLNYALNLHLIFTNKVQIGD